MKKDFAAKTAIVTGAGRGIGRSVALMLAARGAAVVIVDIDGRTAADAAAEVKRSGGSAVAVATDLTQRSQVDEMVKRASEVNGRVDVLINNAGWTSTQPFLDDTDEYWEKVFATNFLSQLYTCRAALRCMTKDGAGVIVNVSSDAARVGSRGQAPYAAAKAAVIGFSRSLVVEFSRFNIRVNVVSPSATDTPLARETLSAEQMEKWAKANPLGRLAKPEDQANAIVFLASDEASYINGQVLSVNGGSSRFG